MDFDPVKVDVADVYKGDELAGTLRRDLDDVVFTYTSDYVASTYPSVATTLPKRNTSMRTRGGAIPAFFAGLLPEGRRLVAVQSNLKTSPDDELSQLLAVGRDCIGDVRIVPEGMRPDPKQSSSQAIEEASEVSFRELFEQSIGEPFAGPTVPGVQEKLSDAMLSLPIRHRGEAVILKLSPAGVPHLVENESLFLSWASDCGLEVPKNSIITDKEGNSGLVISRFDRAREGRKLVRIAQEDAVQVANRWPVSKYKLSTREVFSAVTEATSAPRVAASRLLRLFAFSYVIVNGDLHAKNVSIFNKSGQWAVTPAYDLVSTLPYGDSEMALEIEGRQSKIKGSTFVAFGARFGINEKAARRILNDIVDRLEARIDEVEAIGLDARKTDHLKRVIADRIAETRQ